MDVRRIVLPAAISLALLGCEAGLSGGDDPASGAPQQGADSGWEPAMTASPGLRGNDGGAGQVLAALADLSEESVRGTRIGWRVRDGDPSWWLTRGAKPDGSFCLIRGATGRASVGSACGVVPFATVVDDAGEEMVGVVVPDGYDRATHGGASVEVTHNVAILRADGSRQPVVAITGPAGTLDVTANLVRPADLQFPQMALDGGRRAASPAEIAAVAAEVTEPGTSGPTVARGADVVAPTSTVALRFGGQEDGSVCIGLVNSQGAAASCVPLDEDVRDIANGPLLTAVYADGVRAYLVENVWQALRLPDGRDMPVTANTVAVPADAASAAAGLLIHADGRQVVVALHPAPDHQAGQGR